MQTERESRVRGGFEDRPLSRRARAQLSLAPALHKSIRLMCVPSFLMLSGGATASLCPLCVFLSSLYVCAQALAIVLASLSGGNGLFWICRRGWLCCCCCCCCCCCGRLTDEAVVAEEAAFVCSHFNFSSSLRAVSRPEQDNKSIAAKAGLFLKLYWRVIVVVAWPLFLLPFLLAYDRLETRCAFVVLLMAMFWVTESIPLPMTSLLPLVLFPSLGILSTADTCLCYMNDTIMVFIGGLILAIAIEHCNLHMRIALGVMRFVGCSHRKLLAGLLAVTTFLSMWVSNTACTAMMVPIIFAVLQELEKEGLGKVFDYKEGDPEDPESEREPTKVTKAYLLGAAYSATFGGTATIVGTGTNLTFKGIFESSFPRADGINFTQWMIWATPQALVNIVITWLYVLVFYMGMFRPDSQDAKDARIGSEGEAIANRVMMEKYRKLGRMSFHEGAVSVLFALCVCLWFFRRPGFVTGWSELLSDIDIRDSTPVMFVAILMFVIPKEPSFLYVCSKDANKRPTRSSEGLITWKAIESKMPWSLMFLLGGGFAISKGSNESCLSKRIGESLSPLKELPPFLILCITCLFTGTITEFTSNIGIANIMLPVIAQMSVAVQIHPLYVMIPSALMCSYAFRLPVGTPPNAIITVTGELPVKSLMLGGCGPAIYSFFVVIAMFPTWGAYVYKIKDFPDWARPDNKLVGGHVC
ncbi:protein I'm not dead yet-like isoform X2 [Nasonia vitripennis]|uniref:Protein I'm not dead yet n=1 Tax=Nasonia vitripennis TaxID=7425 RepID=A0A7M7QE79_NASVI|nr:protein I'm not dead yet-like isoform X2 [Nasonia vitripennis]